MTASDWVMSALTTVLVGITLFYALENRKMAKAMRETRDDELARDKSTQGRLVAGWWRRDERNVYIIVGNRSSLPVFSVEARLSNGASIHPYRLRREVLAPEEVVESGPLLLGDGMQDLGSLRTELSFADSSGVKWSRDVGGELVAE